MYRIGVVTATRAEYGLLRRLLGRMQKDPAVELLLFVTGTHLAPEYGNTVSEIEEDGFPIAERIDLHIVGESVADVAESMAIAQREFSRAFLKWRPALLVVLGDRYELLPICSSAMLAAVPIAHISGGEVTVGAIDDVVRHCVTKMSYLHFPACEEYRRRIIQLGEEPERVFDFGDIGLDALLHMNYLTREELEADLGVSLQNPYALTTFHPATLGEEVGSCQVEELLSAIEAREDITFLITKANADMGGRQINDRLEGFCRDHTHCYLFDSLGSRRYISLLKNAAFVLGNSSSGLYEAPAFLVPTINLGDRQEGRIKLDCVLDCKVERNAILRRIEQAMDPDFIKALETMENPFRKEGTVENMLATMKYFLKGSGIRLQKRFYDLACQSPNATK